MTSIGLSSESFVWLHFFAVSTHLALGQGGTAQISGTVRDAGGLEVLGADVKVTETATGVVRTLNPDASGPFVFPNLPVGPYVLEVLKEEFSKYVQSGIVLQVDQNATVDATLKVGAGSE